MPPNAICQMKRTDHPNLGKKFYDLLRILFWELEPKSTASRGSADQIHSKNQVGQILHEPAIVLVSKMVRHLKFGQTVTELWHFFKNLSKF